MIRYVLVAAACLVAATAGAMRAQDLSGLARLDTNTSRVADRPAGSTVETDITLSLSQPVPWRLFTIDGPPRLIVDFRTITKSGDIDRESALIDTIEFGATRDGWSRLVFRLTGPATVKRAGMERREDGDGVLLVALAPADAEDFAALARPLPDPGTPIAPKEKVRPVVVLDPGHGGIDPGAEAGGLNEKTLMLAFARELQEALIRGGLFDVVLTRERDEFVPLATRISRARAADADVFLSLHADELPEGAGDASGITVYTLDANATDAASRRLAELHDKDDLLAGVEVSEPGDEIAFVLMDLARTDTAPRSDALAESLKGSFRAEHLALVGRPLRSAAFSVLKAPDFPSVLIELGFLSSQKDRERLTDPTWRASAVRAIEAALVQWSLDDAARAGLRRR